MNLATAFADKSAAVVEEHIVWVTVPTYFGNGSVRSFDVGIGSFNVLDRRKSVEEIKVIPSGPIRAHAHPEILASSSNEIRNEVSFPPFEEIVISSRVANAAGKGNDVGI